MSRLARLSSYKDGRAPSTTIKKLGFTAVRRLVRLKTVLYGYVRSLYGILPCLTAHSRIILCCTKPLRGSFFPPFAFP